MGLNMTLDPDHWPCCYVFKRSRAWRRVQTFDAVLPWLLDNIGPMDENWTWRIQLLHNNDLVFYFKSQHDHALFALTWG